MKRKSNDYKKKMMYEYKSVKPDGKKVNYSPRFKELSKASEWYEVHGKFAEKYLGRTLELVAVKNYEKYNEEARRKYQERRLDERLKRQSQRDKIAFMKQL